MKTLKFQSHLVPLILSGEKKTTRRLLDDKDLKVGDKVSFMNKETGEEFACAILTAIREKKLRDLSEDDFWDYEKWQGKESLLEHYQGFYGDKVGWGDVMKIISFSLIE